ncbi:MAG TPA: 3-carboxy-cis,cis-muconate cycloisomerase [Candidatus Dormibacteraeota bacterium]|nr:3-carboxy-cis,cis-muconate cycloisomerase [Candidatus Dormibacteraeota bacterium]
MPADRLFGPSSTTPAMQEAVSDVAWVQAMLDVEAALARAEARCGLIPAEAAEAIAGCCRADRFDVAALGRGAAPSGTPVVPLVRALTAAVPREAAGYVHWGATSQDVIDTAMMLIARRGLDLLLDDLERVATACAALAERHRATLISARTLLQQALPTTFGLKAAGWLVATLEARDRLAEVRHRRLAVQLGGAAGTLAALEGRGLEVSRELAGELDLPEPALPWHTARARVAELGAALGVAAGTMAKIARDVALMMQTEVGEAFEPAAPGRGGSSTLPHKRNPVAAVEVDACFRGVQAQAGLLLAAMVQEHERAAGAWQAEWAAVTEAFRLTAGAVGQVREVLEGLEVDARRMRSNLDLTRGLLLAEHAMMALAPGAGRDRAHELVQTASKRAVAGGRTLAEELEADPEVRAHLGPEEIRAVLDPATYLGSADALVDRALSEYRRRRSHET